MTNQPHLEPIEERDIDFYGDDLKAVLVASNAEPHIYVPLKPICDALGLNWPSQFKRVQRDPVLRDAAHSIVMTTIKSPRRGNQQLTALPLEMLPGWLFGIDSSRVRDDLRDKIVRYQKECFRVLWNAFKEDILPSAANTLVPAPTTSLTNAEMTLETLRALTHLAEQQVTFERKYDADMAGIHQRMDKMGRFLLDAHVQTDERLAALELRLSPAAPISEDQANEIALAVKTVAAALEATGTITNGYQRVYAELYRRERVGAYRNLPLGRYQAVLDWLHQWHQELTNESTGT